MVSVTASGSSAGDRDARRGRALRHRDLAGTRTRRSTRSSTTWCCYDLVPLGAAGLCWRAGRRVPEERVAWLRARRAWAASVVGNVLFAFQPAQPPAFPSLADLAYLATYPLIAVHLLALISARVPRFRPSDLARRRRSVGWASTAVVTTFVLAPSLDTAGLEANAATLTYPVARRPAAGAARGGHRRSRSAPGPDAAPDLRGVSLQAGRRRPADPGAGAGRLRAWAARPICASWSRRCSPAPQPQQARPRLELDADAGGTGARNGWRTLALPLDLQRGQP